MTELGQDIARIWREAGDIHMAVYCGDILAQDDITKLVETIERLRLTVDLAERRQQAFAYANRDREKEDADTGHGDEDQSP